MMRANRFMPIVITLGIALSACQSDTSDPTAPVDPPPTSALAVDSLLEDSLPANESRYFAVPLGGAAGYVAILSGLTGPMGLASYGTDSTFRTAQCLNSAASTLPKQCSVSPGDDKWFLKVDGSQLSSTAQFCLLVVPDTTTLGVPTPEGNVSAPVEIEAGVPFPGQVGARETSYYRTHGLSPGTWHSVTLFGVTGAVDLFEIGCPSPHMSYHGGTTPQECGGVSDSVTEFYVECGPLNRDGARYYVLVR